MGRTLRGPAGWVAFTVLLILFFVVAWFGDTIVHWFSATPSMSGAQLAWLFGLVAVSVGVLIAGMAVNGRWSGVFIDSRNRYSLSQVQAVLWLILISSGIVAAAVGNVARGDSTPLALNIPPELLGIIGLSATSLVATPVIRNAKRDNAPDPDQAQRTLANLGAARTTTEGAQVLGYAAPDATSVAVSTEGTVVSYADPKETGWVDLVRGEETGNADKIDLGKLQLLYVTAVVLFVYAAAMYANLNPLSPDPSHPTRLVFAAVDASVLGLLGLSHVGALAYQAAPHAKTAD